MQMRVSVNMAAFLSLDAPPEKNGKKKKKQQKKRTDEFQPSVNAR